MPSNTPINQPSRYFQREYIFPLTLCAVPIMMLVIVLNFSEWLIGAPEAISRSPFAPTDAYTNKLSLLQGNADQISNLLTTISFGLVIGLGFCLREFPKAKSVSHIWIAVACTVIAASIFASVFYNLASRLQIFENVYFENTDFSTITKLLINQAIAVAIQASATFYCVASITFARR